MSTCRGIAPTSPLGTTKATTIVILLLIVPVVADSADVGNGSKSGAQRQGRTPNDLVVVIPDKMNAMEGSTFILPCSYSCTISGVTFKMVEWYRITDGREERIYQYTNRESSGWPLQATLVGDVSKCDVSITVSDIQTHDSGQYSCEVTVHPQYKRNIGHLQLTVHPRTDLVVVTPDAKDTTVGSSALLPCSYTCTITDIRHTLVEWFRTIDGHDEKVYKITHRKRSLRPLQVTRVGDESTCDASIAISDIQTHDAGRYRCEVTVYRHDKSTMEDIGYLQLNVHNEPDPAPSPVPGIVPGVIAAILVVAAGVGFYCWKKRQSRLKEAEAPPQEMQPMNRVEDDTEGRSGQVALAEQGDEPNDEERERETSI